MLDVLLNRALDGGTNCYIAFVPANTTSGTLCLLNDGGNGYQGTIQIPSSGTLGNGQCTVNAATSSVSANGNSLTLKLAMSFNHFGGNASNDLVFYLAARSNTLNSGWQSVGSLSLS